MYLAIVTTVNVGQSELPELVNAIPIRTGMLDEEVLSRIDGPITRWAARKFLAKALRVLETDTKNETLRLGLEYS
jgi:hypothetical protein